MCLGEYSSFNVTMLMRSFISHRYQPSTLAEWQTLRLISTMERRFFWTMVCISCPDWFSVNENLACLSIGNEVSICRNLTLESELFKHLKPTEQKCSASSLSTTPLQVNRVFVFQPFFLDYHPIQKSWKVLTHCLAYAPPPLDVLCPVWNQMSCSSAPAL